MYFSPLLYLLYAHLTHLDLICQIIFVVKYRWWISSWCGFLLSPVIIFQKICLIPLSSDNLILCISSSVSEENSYSYKTTRKIKFCEYYSPEYRTFGYPTFIFFDVALQYTILRCSRMRIHAPKFHHSPLPPNTVACNNNCVIFYVSCTVE